MNNERSADSPLQKLKQNCYIRQGKSSQIKNNLVCSKHVKVQVVNSNSHNIINNQNVVNVTNNNNNNYKIYQRNASLTASSSLSSASCSKSVSPSSPSTSSECSVNQNQTQTQATIRNNILDRQVENNCNVIKDILKIKKEEGRGSSVEFSLVDNLGDGCRFIKFKSCGFGKFKIYFQNLFYLKI